MATVLTIGDPHFKSRGISRYQSMSDEIIKHATYVRPDAIVILGDTLHTHESANQKPFNMACNMIRELSRISLTIVLIGNHDYKNNTAYLSDEHFFNPLKHWDNVIIVDKAMDIQIGKYTFAACPYVYPGRFMEALSTHFTEDTLRQCRAVFGHQEIRNVQMGSIKSEIGDIWEDDLPLLITGHIHEYCDLKHNVIYTGTPIQHCYGDGTDKGIYVFTFSDTNFEMQQIVLDVPMKRIYKVTIDEFEALELDANVEAKIIVQCTPEEYRSAEKSGLIQWFRDQGATVIHEDTTKRTSIPSVSPSKPFLEIVYDQIKQDKQLVDVYADIFTIPEQVISLPKAPQPKVARIIRVPRMVKR